MVAPFGDRPASSIISPDGVRIAVFEGGAPDGTPLLLVHGTSADHRTWRVLGPMLAPGHRLHAVDRRGRGDSGDGDPTRYRIDLEIADLAAVADAIATTAGRLVHVIGHSLGGRLALASSLRTRSIASIVAYESAPTGPLRAPGERDALLEALRADLAAGDHDALLARFMTEAVGMPDADLAAFRADPIWPLRAAAAPTIVRELEAAEAAPAIGLDALGRATVPVLQLVGSESPDPFREGAAALDARLVDGRVEVIDGARHGGHHSHATEVAARVEAFIAG